MNWLKIVPGYLRSRPGLVGLPGSGSHRRALPWPPAAGRARQRLEQLAAGTELQLVFEFLAKPGAESGGGLADVERDLLIAPSLLEGQPLLAELARSHRQILLVQVDQQDT